MDYTFSPVIYGEATWLDSVDGEVLDSIDDEVLMGLNLEEWGFLLRMNYPYLSIHELSTLTQPHKTNL